ncbi:MAG: VOC family protein [Flavobacteriaceae bacterium]|nr:VOC family protein [Flavobacteriaceae bacterium]
MKNKIYPCIWCNQNAEQIAAFYGSVLPQTEIIKTSENVVLLQMCGQNLMLLNAPNKITLNPAISLMFISPDQQLIDNIWEELLNEGNILMEKNKYPWSENYGWIQDKFGVSWQLYTGAAPENQQNMVPNLMFTQSMNGKAAEAADFYRSIFPDSEKRSMKLRENGEVEHGEFKILDYLLMIIDGGIGHNFSFNEGISFVINCENQEEIDTYWNAFLANDAVEAQCGWLKDRYGISWQIIPQNLDELLQKPHAIHSFIQMKKIQINLL